MQEFDKLVELANSAEVTEGVNLPKVQLHKWLVLGQTDYLCEYGTLSDGHEKFTPAQKYAQALRELYYLATSVKDSEAAAMEAQASLIEAEEALKQAKAVTEELRAKAKILRAKTNLIRSLTTVEDQMRMVRFYHRKIKELGPSVEAAYPGGIETAEQDNWEAVAAYRLEKEKTPGLARERMDHIPLPPERKAAIGYASGRPDAIATLMVTNPERCEAMGQAVQRLIESKQTEKEAN